jgi:hypothetical protein
MSSATRERMGDVSDSYSWCCRPQYRPCHSPCPSSLLPSLYLTCHLTRMPLVSLLCFAPLLCILFIMHYRRNFVRLRVYCGINYDPTDCIVLSGQSLSFPPHLHICISDLCPSVVSAPFFRVLQALKTQIYITSSSTWYKPTPTEARSCASFLRRLQSSSCAGGRCFSDIVFANSPKGPWRNWSSSMTLSSD